MSTILRRCLDCKVEKQLDQFKSLETSRDGLSACCSECLDLYAASGEARERSNAAALAEARTLGKVLMGKRARAHNLAMKGFRKGIAAGEIKREHCEVCGVADSRPCHPDPKEHLVVDWFCLDHHPYTSVCFRCKETRVDTEFPTDGKNMSGRSGVCKPCRVEENRVRNVKRARAKRDKAQEVRRVADRARSLCRKEARHVAAALDHGN